MITPRSPRTLGKAMKDLLLARWRPVKTAPPQQAVEGLANASLGGHAEVVMNMLDSGTFDEAINEAVASAKVAQPVAFDDLKEFDLQAWAQRCGSRFPTHDPEQDHEG
jgi:hypothetical protein